MVARRLVLSCSHVFAHLLRVLDDLSFGLSTLHHAVHLHDLFWGFTIVERVQLFLELGDFFLVFTKEGILRIFINPRLVLDVLSAASIPQSVHRFVKVVVSGADIGNHDSLRVTTE